MVADLVCLGDILKNIPKYFLRMCVRLFHHNHPTPSNKVEISKMVEKWNRLKLGITKVSLDRH